MEGDDKVKIGKAPHIQVFEKMMLAGRPWIGKGGEPTEILL
jgi:hypothetical protein